VKREKKEEQFNQIVTENSDRIKRICSYYHAGRQDRQEMFQEVLINIWKGLDHFRGESAVGTWIYRIAVNTAISYIGKVNKYLKTTVYADPQRLSFVFDDDTPEDRQCKERQFQRLHNELKMLSVIDNTIISLMLEGLSTKEIADIIGITEPNVRVKIHRIKTEIKRKIGGENYGN
jgi:RNA polymerase sigma-70 factor (ECF subfamily)